MSLHASLKVDKAGAAARTVFTRIERIKEMIKKGEWSQERSVTNLPKSKIVRIKAGKKKVKEEVAAGAPAGKAAGKAAAPAAKAAASKK